MITKAKSLMTERRGSGFYLALITAFQILVSFAIQLYTITVFGTSSETDALYVGLTLPLVVTALVLETFAAVAIPLLTAEPAREVKNLGWQLFFIAGVLHAAIAFALYCLAPFFIPLLVPGFSDAAKRLTIELTRIQVWGLVGSAAYAVLSALYQVRGRFIWTLASTLISMLVGGALLVWKLHEFGISFAAWIQLLIFTLPALLLLPGLGQFEPLAWRFYALKNLWRRMRPLLLGKLYFMIGVPVDRVLASFLAPGSIVIFELVGRLYGAILRILNKGFVMQTLPSLARMAQENRWDDFLMTYRRTARRMLVISVGIIFCMVAALTIAWLLMETTQANIHLGNMNPASLKMICLVTILMAGLLPCASVGNAQINAYYAQGDTVTPTKIGVVMFTVGIVAKVAGFLFAGIEGIALAVTIGAIAQTVVYEIQLRKLIAEKMRASRHAPQTETFAALHHEGGASLVSASAPTTSL